MKALELTVHKKEVGWYGREDTYNSPDGFWAYPASHVDGYAAEKRFTDAELAAEVHAQREAWTAALYDNVYARYMEEEPVLTTMKERFDMGEQAKTLERFANLPHYDEAQS